MSNLTRQSGYWDQASNSKNFSHPLDIVRFSKLVSCNDPILDYGCGQGRLCSELQRSGFTAITGVDYSDGMIEIASVQNPCATFLKVDGCILPFEDASFSAILLFAVLTCIPVDQAQRRLIDELERVLRPGGLLIVSDYPLQDDDRNRTRYERFKDQFETYGTFQLSDGGIVRHHQREWFKDLFASWHTLETIEVDSKTMNGNPARILQMWLKKDNKTHHRDSRPRE